MKLINIRKKWMLGLTIFTLAGGFMAMCACNKQVENLLNGQADYGKDTAEVVSLTPKVLYIVIDGLRGEAIRNMLPPKLSEIAKKSVYTFNSLDNPSTVNAITWSDMLTGVDSAKHKVKTADFAGNQLAVYPSIFTRIKQLDPTMITASFARSVKLDEFLLKDATHHLVLASDNEVVAATKSSLTSQDESLYFAELSAVDSTGRASGYGDDNPDYVRAIEKADVQIGDMVASLQNRPDYNKENWLVVIASNGGGILPNDPLKDSTLYNDSRGNGFIYFYNPRFALNFYAKPSGISYTGATPIYTNTSFYPKVESTTAYDIGPNTEMTISFKMKILALANNTFNPGILKKTESSANSNVGWWFAHNNNTGAIRFVLRGENGTHAKTNNTLTNDDHPVMVDEWHTYTGKVYVANDGKRYMQMYVDGIAVNKDPIDVTGLDCTTATALDLGQRGSYVSGNTNEMITDVEIFNTAIPDDVIALNACKPALDSTRPYLDHLIGYWPCTDGNGEKLKDYSPSHNDMVFINKPASVWNSFNDLSNFICPDINPSYLILTPKGLDIPYQIYQWFGFPVRSSWQLDGRYWPTGYNNLKEN